MFERIIIGIIIGFISGFVFNDNSADSNNKKLIQGFLSLIIVAFIVSSFMFGAVFGLMAIGEIALGFWAAKNITSKSTRT